MPPFLSVSVALRAEVGGPTSRPTRFVGLTSVANNTIQEPTPAQESKRALGAPTTGYAVATTPTQEIASEVHDLVCDWPYGQISAAAPAAADQCAHGSLSESEPAEPDEWEAMFQSPHQDHWLLQLPRPYRGMSAFAVLATRLPRCARCVALAQRFVAAACEDTSWGHRATSRERALWYCEQVLDAHPEWRPLYRQFYVESLYVMASLTHADFFYARLCTMHHAREQLAGAFAAQASVWQRDLTADGDVEANPGPFWPWAIVILVLNLALVYMVWRAIRVYKAPLPPLIGSRFVLLPNPPTWCGRIVGGGDYVQDIEDEGRIYPVLSTIPGKVSVIPWVLCMAVTFEPDVDTGFLIARRSLQWWRWEGGRPERLMSSQMWPRALTHVRLPRAVVVPDAPNIGVAACRFYCDRRKSYYQVGITEGSTAETSQVTVPGDIVDSLTAIGHAVGSLDLHTARMTIRVADVVASNNMSTIVRATVWAKGSAGYDMPPYIWRGAVDEVLLRSKTIVEEVHIPLDGDKTRLPDLLTITGGGEFLAVGNEPFSLLAADLMKGAQAHRLCKHLLGNVHLGPFVDRIAGAHSVLERLIVPSIKVNADGAVYTADHMTIANMFVSSLMAHPDFDQYGTLDEAFVEEIEGRFKGPKWRNFVIGTGPHAEELGARIAAFIKREKLGIKEADGEVSAKPARNISSSAKIQLRGAIVVQRLYEVLSMLGLNVSGMSPSELDAHVAAVTGADDDDGAYVLSFDASKCDARVSPVVRVMELYIAARLYGPNHWALDVLRQFSGMQGTVGRSLDRPHEETITYEQMASRGSGVPDTTYGNTLLMILIYIRVMYKLDISPSHLSQCLRCAGDDSVFRATRTVRERVAALSARFPDGPQGPELLESLIVSAGKFWGQVLEAEYPAPGHIGYVIDHRHWAPGHGVPFLGRRFFDGDRPFSCAIPERVIASFGVSFSSCPAPIAAAGKVLGRVATDPQTFPWCYHARSAACIIQRAGDKNLTSIVQAASEHLPYFARVSADHMTKLAGSIVPPHPELRDHNYVTQRLFYEEYPWANVNPFLRHCANWRAYPTVLAFYLATPLFGADPGVHIEPAFTRISGPLDVWLKEVPELTVAQINATLRGEEERAPALPEIAAAAIPAHSNADRQPEADSGAGVFAGRAQSAECIASEAELADDPLAAALAAVKGANRAASPNSQGGKQQAKAHGPPTEFKKGRGKRGGGGGRGKNRGGNSNRGGTRGRGGKH